MTPPAPAPMSNGEEPSAYNKRARDKSGSSDAAHGDHKRTDRGQAHAATPTSHMAPSGYPGALFGSSAASNASSTSAWPFTLPLSPGFPSQPASLYTYQPQSHQGMPSADVQNYASQNAASMLGSQQAYQLPDSSVQRMVGRSLLDLIARLKQVLNSYNGEESAAEARRRIVEARDEEFQDSGSGSGRSDKNDGGLLELLLQYTGCLDFLAGNGSRQTLQTVVDRLDNLFVPNDAPAPVASSSSMFGTAPGAWDPELDAGTVAWTGAVSNTVTTAAGQAHEQYMGTESLVSPSMPQHGPADGQQWDMNDARSTFPPFRNKKSQPRTQAADGQSQGALRSSSAGQQSFANSQPFGGAAVASNVAALFYESPASQSPLVDLTKFPGDPSANSANFFPRAVGSSVSASQTGSSNSRTESTKVAQRTHSGSAQESDPTTLTTSASPPTQNLTATLSPASIQALSMVLTDLPANIPQVPGPTFTPLVRALNDLSMRLRNNGDSAFLEPLLRQIGWHDGIGARQFTIWWKGMVETLLDQQQKQMAARNAAVEPSRSTRRERRGSPAADSGDDDGDRGRARRDDAGESGRERRRGRSGTEKRPQPAPLVEVKQDPADASLQTSSFGLLALAMSLMPGREEEKKEENMRRRSGAVAAQGAEEWRTRILDYVAGAPSRDDPFFREMLATSGLSNTESIEGFIQNLAIFIVQKLPKAYRAVRKALGSFYCFLSALKTNNNGIDSRKVDNMIQGQLCYHAMRLHQHPQGAFDAAFRSCLVWSRSNVSEVYFGISEQPETESNSVDLDRLSTDIFGFISYDPIGVEGGQGSEPSEAGGDDEGSDKAPTDVAVPKIEYINSVAEALLLVEYLRVSKAANSA